MELVVKPIRTEPSKDTLRRIDYLKDAKDEWETRLIAGFPNRMVANIQESPLSDEATRRENMYEDRGL